MKLSWFVVAVAISFSTSSYASTHVVCGQRIDPISFEVHNFELATESVVDEFAGPVGANWNLRLADSGSGWMEPNSNFEASTYQDGQATVVEIELRISQAMTGPVGLTYLLIHPFSEKPVLEKYALGGYMHNVKLGSFECIRVGNSKPNINMNERVLN